MRHILAALCLLLAACFNQESSKKEQIQLSDWIEYRRTFPKGYAYSEEGQLIRPKFELSFQVDSVKLQSKADDYDEWLSLGFLNDSILRLRFDYYKIKSITKDSLWLQKLVVQNNRLKLNEYSLNLYFISKKQFHSLSQEAKKHLFQPSRLDTLYLLQLISMADNDESKLIPARQPVLLPTNKNARVIVYPVNNDILADNFPWSNETAKCELIVDHAKDNVRFLFSIYIAANGKISLGGFIAMPEFWDIKKKYLNWALEHYIKPNFKAIPGSTLNIRHRSEVIVRLICNK